MSEKKNVAPVIALIVLVAVAVLAIPCVLGALFFGGAFLWKSNAVAPAPTNTAPASGQAREGDSSEPARLEPSPAVTESPVPNQPNSFRLWTLANGISTVEAKVEGVENGIVTLLKRDGTKVVVSPNNLSEPDQEYLKAVQSGLSK